MARPNCPGELGSFWPSSSAKAHWYSNRQSQLSLSASWWNSRGLDSSIRPWTWILNSWNSRGNLRCCRIFQSFFLRVAKIWSPCDQRSHFWAGELCRTRSGWLRLSGTTSVSWDGGQTRGYRWTYSNVTFDERVHFKVRVVFIKWLFYSLSYFQPSYEGHQFEEGQNRNIRVEFVLFTFQDLVTDQCQGKVAIDGCIHDL